MNARGMNGLMLMLLMALCAGCGTASQEVRSLTTEVPGPSPEVSSPSLVDARDVYVLSDVASDTVQPGIIEGMISVNFVTDERGNVLRLPSGRPLIRQEAIMRDLARSNLQQNCARYMQGTVVEAVTVATAEFLNNKVDQDEVVAYQQLIYRTAFKQRLPALQEKEWLLVGNVLTVRADVRPQARQLAEESANEALQAAVRSGRVSRDDAMSFLSQTLQDMGL